MTESQPQLSMIPTLNASTPPGFCQYAGARCDQPFDHFKQTDIFAAYASEPATLSTTIDGAVEQLRRAKPNHRWLSWKDLATGGQIIFCEICRSVRFAKVFVADVTILNFNVLFELGYALGLEKPIRLLRDPSYARDAREFEDFGIIDTIGYDPYSNSDDIVASLLKGGARGLLVPRAVPEYRSSPIYVVLPSVETEGVARLTTALKKSAFSYRVYDAKETPRLAFSDLQRHVVSSTATVLPLLDEKRVGARVHNARCALVAGLALARGFHVLMVQEGLVKQPIDYRDLCQPYSNARYIPTMVERLVKQVATTLSSSAQSLPPEEQRSQLSRLDLGDIAAENEDEQLRTYFVRTSQYQETERGHARLVVGRKGTGKSAIFSQLREEYVRRTHDFAVVDLRPEGYQLRKLVELMRKIPDMGVREQLSTTLWYYLLLTELAYCVLDRDVSIAYRDPMSLAAYQEVERLFERLPQDESTDFSDRLLTLTSKVHSDFPWGKTSVSSAQINETIWSGDLGPASTALAEYLARKKKVWLLVDNLDKSWPARGATEHELLVLRCLLEASRKLQKVFQKKRVPLHTVVFVRNDIFEQLLSETPDRGKESSVHLDRSDDEVLREILRRRAVASLGAPMTFEEFAKRFFDMHVGGEDAFRFLFRHTFGRARDVLRLTKRCIETALNRGHSRVCEDDIRSSVEGYSTDLLRELIYEVRDSFGEHSEAIEEFVGCPQTFGRDEIVRRILPYASDADSQRKMIDALLWYCFLGVQLQDGSEAYAYEDEYNVERLLRRARAQSQEEVFVVHSAFRAALHIGSAST
jgi:Cdc6-like AAA superfamily ATPase